MRKVIIVVFLIAILALVGCTTGQAASTRCTPGATQTCVTSKLGLCKTGTQTCTAKRTWGICVTPTPVTETCDGKDNDCDGLVDDGVAIKCSQSSDCGIGQILNDTRCSGQNVVVIQLGYICSNPGTCNSACNSTSSEYVVQACGSGQACVNGACVSSCIPQCAGKTCGPDGCGGSCGYCNGTCTNGQCVTACYPNCAGKQCGPDGCGGSCGICTGTCVSGQCNLSCAPSCTGKVCGDNGCGGSCGTCAAGQSCSGGACLTAQCSATADGICPTTCSAGSDADCCTNVGKYWLQYTYRGLTQWGCYATNYNPGCGPSSDCSLFTGSADGCCPQWCGPAGDADCCTQSGLCWTGSTCGSCTDICTDSDGGMIYSTAGWVYNRAGTMTFNRTDFCVNSSSTMLAEYYCLGTQLNMETVDCTSVNASYCSDGACVY